CPQPQPVPAGLAPGRGRVTTWKVHPVVIVVVDVQAARELVAAGAMRCPDAGCPGTLRAWSRARARTVTVRGGLRVQLRPYRVCCRACTVTHVLLPAGCLSRRAYDVETVGTVLLSAAAGAGTRRAAVTAGVPRSTARAWLRAVRDHASALTATAVTWTLEATVPSPHDRSQRQTVLRARGTKEDTASRAAHDDHALTRARPAARSPQTAPATTFPGWTTRHACATLKPVTAPARRTGSTPVANNTGP
ncbi:MAG TPA: hypothetical protein VI248_10920, partial [Kineosporiaceae bacterium]